MDRAPFTEDVEAGGAEVLLASTIYLMSRFAASPCAHLARLVDRHLAAVAAQPACGALVRETCRRARTEWRALKPGCPLGFDAAPCEEHSVAVRDPGRPFASAPG